MEGALNLKLKLNAQFIADLWQEQCSLHTNLFELTCDEYIHLLASDLDKLEETIEMKNQLIKEISALEDRRKLHLQDINTSSPLSGDTAPKSADSIQKLSQLCAYFKENGLGEEATRIEKLNLVLLDIIDKIQEQNKKNQVFLNKALISLKELKNSFSGTTKRYETYGSNGATRKSL